MYFDLALGELCEPLSGLRWDAQACADRVARRAAHLHWRGVQRGQRVFLNYGNRADFFIDIVALWSLGACPVPIDPRLTAFEVEHLARAVRPTFSVWDRDVPSDYVAALVRHDVGLLDLGIDQGGKSGPAATGLPMLDDDALILFTSGTTGQPKGVVHTHRSLRARWISQYEKLGTRAYARTLCFMPTNFAWGLIGNSLFPWLSGQSLYILPAFRTDVVLQMSKLCDQHAITHLPTVPTIWRMALRTVSPPKNKTLLRISSGTSPLPAELWRDIARWSGAPEVMNVYGITETGWIGGCTTPDVEPQDGLIGDSWGSLIRIVEPAAGEGTLVPARVCKPGEIGQIWVQTPALMRGYFGREDLTNQVISKGWFVTGDIGTIEANGQLFVRGRERDIINTGGVKVYPDDIDRVVEGIDGIADVCSFAMPDALQGDSIGVAIVLRAQRPATPVDIQLATAERLAKHQLPRRWFVVDEIPRTGRGKLDRTRVAQACADKTPLEFPSASRGASAASSST